MNDTWLSVLSLSVSGSILAILLFLGKPFLKNKVSRAFSYYIWLLVLLRLVVPIAAPVIPTFTFDWTEPSSGSKVPTADFRAHEVSGGEQVGELITDASKEQAVLSEPPPAPVTPSKKTVQWGTFVQEHLTGIWLTGVMASAGWFLIAYAFFSSRIRRSLTVPHRDDLEVFQRICPDSRIRLAYSSYAASPMLIGLWRPVIVLPRSAYVRDGMARELGHILRHELVHARRRDILYKWVVVIVTSIHWFNPLMLLIRKEIHRACELSCDEAVIRGMSLEEKQSYGNTLLALSSSRKRSAVPLSTTLSDSKQELKERLLSIMNFKPKSARMTVLSIGLTFIFTGCAAMLGTVDRPQSHATATSSIGSTDPTDQGSAPSTAAGIASSDTLKSVLAQSTSSPVHFFQSFAVEEDQEAAFALAGGEVWYITAAAAQKLKSGIAFSAENRSDAPVLWKVDDTIFFKCESIPGGSSSQSYAWYVKEGSPVEVPYTGMSLAYTGSGQFTTIGESYDMVFTDGMGAGHTYKRYYLYWTADGMKEYGGIKMNQQQLLQMKGAKEIIDTIAAAGHTLDDIYYRANNIIHINYHSGDKQNGSFDNMTLVLKDNAVIPQTAEAGMSSTGAKEVTPSTLSDFSYGGVYRASFFPDIATYPEGVPGA